MTYQEKADALFEEQKQNWPLLGANWEKLDAVRFRKFDFEGYSIRVQFNPKRIISSAAKVDKDSIKKRACFLCLENREAVQNNVFFEKDYEILCNPFPIFREHFTISRTSHVPQEIEPEFLHFLELSRELPELVVFYNAPACGASAPDHMHFQAGTRGLMPIDEELEALKQRYGKSLIRHSDLSVTAVEDGLRKFLVLESNSREKLKHAFSSAFRFIRDLQGQEPMINMLSYYKDQWQIILFPRDKHRPWQYFEEGEKNILLSPASVDMGGTLITPLEKDFEKITREDIKDIFKQISFSSLHFHKLLAHMKSELNVPGGSTESEGQVPLIEVGVLSGKRIDFFLEGAFKGANGDEVWQGAAEAKLSNGLIEIIRGGNSVGTWDSVILKPLDTKTNSFVIHDVVIGIGFHWEQKEDQEFRGALKLLVSGDRLQVINLVSVEEYLISVISSEMRGDSSPALLKAHTIISRSWLLAQIEKQDSLEKAGESYELIHRSKDELIRWYDREDHDSFHVCADDHCQRYQGITRAHNPEVVKAVNETAGEVLVYGGKICDARFSKCCGGVVEEFQNCWEPVSHPYLRRVDDNPASLPVNTDDLKIESNAVRFIHATPDAFCNTRDETLLRQVLNDYDQTTREFYRWELQFKQEELAALIKRKSGIDFGKILDLQAIKRGESGRLVKLRIVGEKKTLTIGKELEIRRCLSESHLFSSAFTVEKQQIVNGIPGYFLLKGAGWGHGVGLCQIGAAVMASKGYSHKEILEHYFIDANLEKRYEYARAQ